MTDTFRQGETWQRTLSLETEDGDALDLTGYTFVGQIRVGPGKTPYYSLVFVLVPHPTTAQANHAVSFTIDNTVTVGITPGTYQCDIFATPPGGEPFAIPFDEIKVIARITIP